MDDKPIAISIVGAAGSIGRRHVSHVLSEPLTCLHSIVDLSSQGKEMASSLKVFYFDDLNALLAAEPLPTAVVLATPSSLHISQAMLLVPIGIHVLIEKPLCNSSHEVEPLIEACKKQGAGSILVGFHRRFNPYVLRMKKILAGQSSLGKSPLGRILAINGLWCTRKPMSYFTSAAWRQSLASGGGVIMTNLSHELDLMSSLFGPIKRVFAEVGAKTRGFDVEETVAITLKFVDGCVGTYILSDAALTPHSFESATGENPHLAVHNQPTYTIMGTRGTINFPNLDYWSYLSTSNILEKSAKVEGDWTKQLDYSNQESLPFDKIHATDVGDMAPFTSRLRHWVAAIRGQEIINCTLEDGLRNIKLLEAITKSAREGIAVNL